MTDNKLIVDYIPIEQLEKQYIEGTLEYSNLGVALNRNFPICLFFYPNAKKRRFYIDVTSTFYDIDRKKIVDYIIEYIINNKRVGKKLPTSYRKIKEIKSFIEYTDKHHFNILDDVKSAQKAYFHFTKYLQNTITNGSYKQRTAQRLQKVALDILSSLHDIKNVDISNGTTYIHAGNEIRTTEPKNENDMQYCFMFYYELFNATHDFIIENKSYPSKFNISGKTYWLFPYLKQFVANKHKKKTSAFDFNIERVLTFEDLEYRGLSQYEKDTTKRAIRKFNNCLQEVNQDYYSKQREVVARLCSDSYFMIFLFTTGMNDTTAGTLLWDEDYKTTKEIQNFKNIKYRANNRRVEFNIAKKFVKEFEKYLDIRKYLLNGSESKYLFFDGSGEKNYLSNKKSSGSASSHINNTIKNIFEYEKLKGLSSRTIRLYKAKYLIKKSGVIEASSVLQTNISTLIKHYTQENNETYSEQITSFFNNLNEKVFSETDKKMQDIPIGKCIDYGKPNTEVQLNAINIDCKKSEGCLFCDKFRCHADDEDIRKLYSVLFLIEETRKKASSIEHFNSVYLIVIERINNLMKELSKKHDSVEQIKKDVFENENLTYYWERKLEMLNDLKVL